jgi:prepilin signal peptidase PulO-like enzyme (type II secretory pathway)
MVRATTVIHRCSFTPIQWKKYCCIASLALSLISWLCAVAVLTMATLRWGDTLLIALFWLGMIASPVALVTGLVTTIKPGYLSAKSAAAMAFFWTILWMSLGRGV